MKRLHLYLIAAVFLLSIAVWRLAHSPEPPAETPRIPPQDAASAPPAGKGTAPPPSLPGDSAGVANSLREGDARRGPPPEPLAPAQLIEQALRSESPAERSNAAGRLSRLAFSEAERQKVLAAFQNPAEEEEIRVRAVELLKLIGDRAAIPALEEAALRDSSERVRQAASEALGWLGN